jgi:hypothetical protein
VNDSLVTGTLNFANSKHEVMDVLIDTMTKLGRGGPSVDRLLGKVSGPIKKKQVPFFRCNAECTVSEKAGTTTVFIAVICEVDHEASKKYSQDAYRQIIKWTIGPNRGLSPII